jgi:hypothetical protein
MNAKACTVKTWIILFLGSVMSLTACQKSAEDVAIMSNMEDSTIVAGDTLTYEVLTSDTIGWSGVWNKPDNNLATNALDRGTFGSPVYLPSGWRYTFVSPAHTFQAWISVATSTNTKDITANLYRNGTLIKTATNKPAGGFAKLLADVKGDSLTGTPSDPVLMYEVLVSEQDTTKFQSDGWLGQWTTASGVPSDLNDPLAGLWFAIPSGWKYTFKPGQLPFTMRMAASPYTKNGGKVTINFFVNGQLVKSSAVRDWIYDMQHTMQ